MKPKNIRILIETKRNNLVNIACRKIRHAEKEKFERRKETALKFLGELNIASTFLESKGFHGFVVNDEYLEILRRSKKNVIETLYEGEFVRVYLHKKEDYLMLILASVSDLESFKFRD